uniref:Uncharacterized protein n=1 Tax=Oncorhynchus mykiss TaxID=8022 RepID=A0A8K9XK26_ONCMY
MIGVTPLVYLSTLALCVYEGRHFSLGESWMEDGCLQCTLHYAPLINVPFWVVVRVDTLTCKMTLVQSADPRLPCSPGFQLNVNMLRPRPHSDL